MIRIDLRHSTDKRSEHCASSAQPLFGQTLSVQKSIPTLNLYKGAPLSGEQRLGKYDKSNCLRNNVSDAELKEQFSFVTKQLQTYCNMCDASAETYQVMKTNVPCLVYGLKKGDTTKSINSLLRSVGHCFQEAPCSIDFKSVMIGALVIIEKGFAKHCYIHSRTALR